MGMPGAGKGTQAEMLSHDIRYHQFSTGSAFRQIALEDSDLGRKVKHFVDNGFLTPPEIAAQVVLKAVHDLLAEGEGIVFDGTPRTVEEAKTVKDRLLEEGYGVPLVIYLEVDKETMIERNSKRRLCLNVEKEFPVTTHKDEEKCTELGGKVGTRPDDEKEKFTTRYNQFMELTYPVIESHKSEHPDLFYRVNGLLEPHQVHALVMDIIKQFEM
jgi:adenylate kinase